MSGREVLFLLLERERLELREDLDLRWSSFRRRGDNERLRLFCFFLRGGEGDLLLLLLELELYLCFLDLGGDRAFLCESCLPRVSSPLPEADLLRFLGLLSVLLHSFSKASLVDD